MNPLVTAWAASFCKSVGVCLRRFESCTCHPAKRASDQHVCRSGALRRVRGDQCFRVLPDNFRPGSRRRPDSAGRSRPSEVVTRFGHPAYGASRQRPATSSRRLSMAYPNAARSVNRLAHLLMDARAW